MPNLGGKKFCRLVKRLSKLNSIRIRVLSLYIHIYCNIIKIRLYILMSYQEFLTKVVHMHGSSSTK